MSEKNAPAPACACLNEACQERCVNCQHGKHVARRCGHVAGLSGERYECPCTSDHYPFVPAPPEERCAKSACRDLPPHDALGGEIEERCAHDSLGAASDALHCSACRHRLAQGVAPTPAPPDQQDIKRLSDNAPPEDHTFLDILYEHPEIKPAPPEERCAICGSVYRSDHTEYRAPGVSWHPWTPEASKEAQVPTYSDYCKKKANEGLLVAPAPLADGGCVCGEPTIPNTNHRDHGPCYQLHLADGGENTGSTSARPDVANARSAPAGVGGGEILTVEAFRHLLVADSLTPGQNSHKILGAYAALRARVERTEAWLSCDDHGDPDWKKPSCLFCQIAALRAEVAALNEGARRNAALLAEYRARVAELEDEFDLERKTCDWYRGEHAKQKQRVAELEGRLSTEEAERVRCRDGWAKANARVAELERVIEEAEHGRFCMTFNVPPDPCDCFKSKAKVGRG